MNRGSASTQNDSFAGKNSTTAKIINVGIDFLKQLFDGTEHEIEIRCLPSREQFYSTNLAEIENFLKKNIRNQNVYFGCCTREGGKGDKAACREVFALWIDLDLKDLAGGQWEADKIIENMITPSVIVCSGNGYHIYWLLREPVEAIPEIVEPYLKGLAQHYNGDMAATEIARILRVPGTFNYKDAKKKPVTIVKADYDLRYNLSDFDDLRIDAAADAKQKRSSTNSVDLRELTDKCAFIKFCDNNRNDLPEPFWYAMISNVSRISPGGPDLVHAISRGYAKYTRAETDQKILHALNSAGPHTCQAIKESMQAYTGKDCGHDCKVTSPVVLFMKKEKLEQHTQQTPDDKAVCRPIYVSLQEITGLILKHILLPQKKLATLVTFWILGTYCFELFSYFGYLALRSATPRCGKSRLLRLLALFVKGNPPIRATPSAASLFRSNHVVTILDEVDKLRNQDKEIYGEILAILNCGFEKGGVVERVEKRKEGFIVKEFSVYGPKALAGIEGLADTLSDRAFQVQMVRSPKRMPRFNARKLEETAKQIRSDMEGFADKFGADIVNVYGSLPDEMPQLANFDDRFQDIAEPLLIIAAIIDADLPCGHPPFIPALVESLKIAAGRREPSGREKQIGAFLREIKNHIGDESKQFISTDILLSLCRTHEDLSRIENGKSLSNFLKHFDLVPVSNGKLRGYNISRDWVNEWEGIYCADET